MSILSWDNVGSQFSSTYVTPKGLQVSHPAAEQSVVLRGKDQNML